MSKASILVVEDDPDIRELLAYTLGREGYAVRQEATAEAGLVAMREGSGVPDVMLLDVMLPGMDGLELLRKVKTDPELRKTSVIMASAKGEEADIVAGLELGADDYVTKPFSPRVLVARVRAALRRSSERESTASEAVVERGNLLLDAERHEVRVEDGRVDLSATEFAVLELLVRSPGRVFTRSRVIDSIRGRDYPVTDRSVDVQILSIRKKLGPAGDNVETVRGVGYRWKDE